MTLFVGGMRHGQDIDMDATPPNGDGVRHRPPSYVDSTTGEAYILSPASLQLTHPLTGQPIPGQLWEQEIYVLTTVAGDPNPQMKMAVLADSVTRWWFTTHGTHKADPAQSNGHHEQVRYIAICHGCADLATPDGHGGQPKPFATPGDRARWMTTHIDATGHTVSWRDETPTQGVTDAGQDQRNIPQGHQGI